MANYIIHPTTERATSSQNSDWAAHRVGAFKAVSDTIIQTAWLSNTTWYSRMVYMSFNTAGIPVQETITDVRLALAGVATNPPGFSVLAYTWDEATQGEWPAGTWKWPFAETPASPVAYIFDMASWVNGLTYNYGAPNLALPALSNHVKRGPGARTSFILMTNMLTSTVAPDKQDYNLAPRVASENYDSWLPMLQVQTATDFIEFM